VSAEAEKKGKRAAVRARPSVPAPASEKGVGSSRPKGRVAKAAGRATARTEGKSRPKETNVRKHPPARRSPRTHHPW
jgi:hypothetical protein